MEEKLDLILKELSGVKEDIKEIKDEVKAVKIELSDVKAKQVEVKTIVSAIKVSQEMTNAKTTALEGIQERQQLLMETLSYRSIQQESDIKELKRIIQNQ
ncbi:hypothetical protein [Metabacillus bambusae]|uniref:Uncharacterized protein n=1 Tax=Metabacillus bambusae TaxID=2795218 RepID=A0ABS3N027_9BACI|nr:hypothetical protein [Metabacillus bambusae]MBO1511621.1 hypothetical protein [Metabacillus bambusae]